MSVCVCVYVCVCVCMCVCVSLFFFICLSVCQGLSFISFYWPVTECYCVPGLFYFSMVRDWIMLVVPVSC